MAKLQVTFYCIVHYLKQEGKVLLESNTCSNRQGLCFVIDNWKKSSSNQYQQLS